VLIALVILPVLPNKSYGPYGFLNPFETWLVVVLIVGISLVGYLAYKVLDSKLGTLIGGILGGLISSTATTIEYARKVSQQPSLAAIAATVIAIASTMSVARVLIEISVVAPSLLLAMSLPCALFLVSMCVGSAVLFWRSKGDSVKLSEQGNPAQLKSAIIFGCVYTLIGLAVGVTKATVGQHGLFVVGAVSGLTDVDALTLSVAQLAQRGGLDAHTAWQVILIGVAANTLFKGLVAIGISRGALSRYLGPAFICSIAVCAAVIFLWPKDLTNSLAEKSGHRVGKVSDSGTNKLK
jgi:uncharacterized membrane protein (DUF4010 family)